MTSPPQSKDLIGTDGRRITRRAIQRGLRVNIVAGAFGMIWAAAAMGMTTILFLESLGASGVMIGMIVTIQQLAMFMQIPAAYFAERLATRKPFWAWCVIPQRVMWLVPAVLPFILGGNPRVLAWSILAVVAVSSLLTFTGSASWHSWMADFIPEHTRGRFWGLRQSVTMFAYLIGVAISGWILDRFPDPSADNGSYMGFSIVFVIAAVAGTLDIIIHLWVPEPQPSHTDITAGLLKRVLAPLKDRDFRYSTLAFGAWSFALGLVGSFSIIYLKRNFSASYSQIAMVTISASIGAAISGLLWGRIMDMIGGRAFGGVMLFIVPLFGSVWFIMRDFSIDLMLPVVGMLTVPQPILVLTVVNLFAGAFFHGVVLCQFTMAAALAPKEGRTMAMAVHWTLIGAIAAMGPVLGGKIMDFFEAHPVDFYFPTGTEFAFMHPLVVIHVLVIWAISLPLLMRIRKKTGDVSVRLLIANPLRTVGTLQNVLTIGTAVTSTARAAAVRKIGISKSAVALSELIKRLNDPASDVREEAALAIGRIGTPEAINALLEYLDDPQSDLGPHIARGLRESRHPDSVDPLLRQLEHGDRETRVESARALGEIGDPRATDSLLLLLRKSDDSKLVSASSEALARLGEIAAIHDILPRMKTSRNPVLRRSLAVAVGDLLAGRQGFYSMLLLEEDSPSEAVVNELGKLNNLIRRRFARRKPEQCRRLTQIIANLEEAYEEERFVDAAQLAHEAAAGLSECTCAAESSPVGTECQNDRLAVGMWYLDYLSHHWPRQYGTPDKHDVLLGIHFLASHFGDEMRRLHAAH